MHLVAIMDGFRRHVITWRLSDSVEGAFCVAARQAVLSVGRLESVNTDKGSRFTSESFTSLLREHNSDISMDGRGRVLDNVFLERLWRTFKSEDMYLKEYTSTRELQRGLQAYFRFYNEQRPQSSLGLQAPAEVYHGRR